MLIGVTGAAWCVYTHMQGVDTSDTRVKVLSVIFRALNSRSRETRVELRKVQSGKRREGKGEGGEGASVELLFKEESLISLYLSLVTL